MDRRKYESAYISIALRKIMGHGGKEEREMAMKELALYVAEQLSGLDEVRYIPMMGGWLFYYKERIIGGIYGDGFAVKDTKASWKYMPDCRNLIWDNTPKTLLPCTILDDSERLCAMVEEMYDELPDRKPRKKRK